MIQEIEAQQMLAEDIGGFTHDPLGFARYAFPWGEGELAKANGPRKWQREILESIGEHLRNPETRHQPCRIAVSSGHGIGKSALISMILLWGLSTFENARGTVTANTDNQLKTKTSPEVARWHRLTLVSEWFEKTVTALKAKEDEHRETWRVDFVPWSEANPAAAAGLHNQGKRLLLIFDEASEIPQIIFDTGHGVMTDEDTEILWIAFGNPTRNQGPFYDAVFGDQRHRWKHFVIDSREVEGTNKQELEEWAKDFGEESDFFRVRVRGLPPRSGSAQFIDSERIQEARKRPAVSLPDDPLVAGVDFAWGGDDWSVVRFRKGLDARSIPPIKIKGEFTKDPAVMTGKLADVLTRTYAIEGTKQKVAMLFFDSAGIAAPVEARLRALGYQNIMVVNFGADSIDRRYAYMRDYMWGQMKEWLEHGAIDTDPDLEADLAKPVLVTDRLQRVKLEPKDRMKSRLAKMGIDSSSPDDGDALALTFAQPVAPAGPIEAYDTGNPYGESGWML